jgi:adenosylmethionine-8-amino-7-oxononanoate aminotransferase
MGGPFVVNIGHGVPEIITAMEEQARKVCFPYAGNFASEAQVELAEEVIQFCPTACRGCISCPGVGSQRSGLKLARQYHLEREPPG